MPPKKHIPKKSKLKHVTIKKSQLNLKKTGRKEQVKRKAIRYMENK